MYQVLAPYLLGKPIEPRQHRQDTNHITGKGHDVAHDSAAVPFQGFQKNVQDWCGQADKLYTRLNETKCY